MGKCVIHCWCENQPRWFAAVVFLIIVVAGFGWFQLNGRTMVTGDSVPYRYLPESIALDQTFRLDRWEFLNERDHYALVRDQYGNLVSKKPVLPAVLEIPVFLTQRARFGELNEWQRMEVGKITMSLIGALSAAGIFLCLFRRVPLWMALQAPFLFLMATPFWFTAMDCWPHPLLAFCHVYTLVLLRRPTLMGWLVAGFLQGAAITTRLGSIPVAIVFAIAPFVLLTDWRERWKGLAVYTAGILPPLLILMIYQYNLFGNPFTSGFQGQASDRIRFPLMGMAGLLFSPAKGLFLFSPVLLLMLFVRPATWARERWLSLAGIGFVLHLILWGSYADWWGGWGWGPRYLAEVTPFAVIFVTMALGDWWGRSPKAIGVLFVLLLTFSIAVQLIGMFRWDGAYHEEFDAGWGEGRSWIWQSPYEPLWRLQQGHWYRPDYLRE